MELIQPDFGLLFWKLIVFGIVVYILKKFAWKTIVSAIKEREKYIEQGINNAETVKEQIKGLDIKVEKMLLEARIERDELVKQGRELKEKIITEGRETAELEIQKMMENARINIKEQKQLALNEIKAEITDLSIQIAEKILRNKMKDKDTQKELVASFLENIKNN